MERITLTFHGVSELGGTQKVGLIILTDEERRRELSIVCDSSMIAQIMLRVQQVPGVKQLLPEVLYNVLSNQTMLDFYITFNDCIDGEYQVVLYNRASLIPVKMRASDAVLLHIISGIPMYMNKSLFLKQSTTYEAGTMKVAIPLNSLNEQLLREALDEAIQNEEYEMASALRDELRRRFPEQDGNDNKKLNDNE